MKTVLITAYAVNPYKGSEDGTGWNITSEIAKDYKVILITRKNNVPFVEQYLKESDIPHLKNITCHGFDLSDFTMKMKKKVGERGYVAYYYMWQYRIVKFIQKSGFEFDIAHSLNFHSDSQPNFLWKLGKPTFWGPIGHHPRVQKEFITKHYAYLNYVKDKLYGAVKWSFRNLDPYFKKAVKNSTKIFVINSSVGKVISAPSDKVIKMPAVASVPVADVDFNQKNDDEFVVLSVGRFHYMKGFDLTIEAFSKFIESLPEDLKEKCKLRLVGKGEEKETLEKLAKQKSIWKHIDWIDWVEKEEMENIYRTSDVFLFPSHEGAGMVVPEAMSYGLPIICLDNYGPGELVGDAGLKVKYASYKNVVLEFSKHLINLINNKPLQEKLSQLALDRFKSHFTWEEKGLEIKKHYRHAI